MKIIGTLFFMTFFLQANGFDIKKLGIAIDAQLLWTVSSFNDVKRLYSFRPSLDGAKRELNSLESIGISYTHVTEGGILLTPCIKIGQYGQEGAQSNWFGLDFTLAKYHFQDHARYLNVSVQKDFANTLGTSTSISLGVLSKIWEKQTSTTDLTHIRMGIGLLVMRNNGLVSTGLQFKFHCWQFGFLSR